MKFLKYLLLSFFILLLSFSIYSLFKIQHEEKANEDLKNELIQEVHIPDVSTDEEEISIDFTRLKEINEDIVGWIVIEDTQINYPIVQGSNNSYYLNHSYDKKWSGYGSIFMDYSSSNDFSNYNTFIYGHHTQNGSMFGELYKYMDESFYQSHPYFRIYTPKSNYVLDVFSVYVDDTESDSYKQEFSSLEDYEKYIDAILSKSKYKTNVNIDYKKDKIVTLYSCSHERSRNKNDRYFIHTILRSV